MSNNKTVIPGLEGSSAPVFQSSPSVELPSNVHYNGGTVIPGISQGVVAAVQQSNSKPVVGFLYSISRTGNGEFWPLHIGPNIIGRSKSCDVYLPEATVSELHAEFVVRILKNPEKLIASIYDQRSTCGTMINGESLGFEPRECSNGDIITIGEHYDLFVTLIDAKLYGLKVCSTFIPIDVEQLNPFDKTGNQSQNIFGPQVDVPFVAQNQYPTQEPPHFQPGRTAGAENNGSNSSYRTEPGKTIFM